MARQGTTRLGSVRFGVAVKASQGVAGLGSARNGTAVRARPVSFGHGRVRQGTAVSARLGGSGPVAVGLGMAVVVWLGTAWQGSAWLGPSNAPDPRSPYSPKGLRKRHRCDMKHWRIVCHWDWLEVVVLYGMMENYAVIDGVRYEVLWTDASKDPDTPDNLIAELAPVDPDPTVHDLIVQLRDALGLFSGAMPISPKEAWEEALERVRGGAVPTHCAHGHPRGTQCFRCDRWGVPIRHTGD